MDHRMPALFIGHGSPMNAIEDNDYTRMWADLGRRIARPSAILAISAHWETKGVLITAAERQRTIHDFYNFPPEFYQVTYAAPGNPVFAREIEALLAPYARADLDSWGLDHGTWSVLRNMYPAADIPVVQISMDTRRSPADHYEIGQALAKFRDQGVLVLGSGNLVHNLRQFRPGMAVPAWAVRFNDAVKDKIAARDHRSLIDYATLDPEARLAVPETEHYLPLLYVLATQQPQETATILSDTLIGSIAMTSVALGLDPVH